VPLENLAQSDHLALRDLRVTRAIRVIRVTKAIKVIRDLLV
jgi:hypothetical protein